jgi:putative flippase GtrA
VAVSTSAPRRALTVSTVVLATCSACLSYWVPTSLPAQVAAIVLVTPLSFLGNKLSSFTT